MSFENGEWIMRGLDWDNPKCLHTASDLENLIMNVGFMPLFANDIRGFSVEEHTDPDCWWTGNVETDPWEWREAVAEGRKVAYGKLFDKKAGFISLDWLPSFANYRRNGYDFDARWDEGLAGSREKQIMDILVPHDTDGDAIWEEKRILSTDLKKLAGFGKQGEKNFPGTITRLQMQTYLVITDFRRRKNKRSREYGMAVSVLAPPETVWGYDAVTAGYKDEPAQSWRAICEHVRHLYPSAGEKELNKLIGGAP